MWLDHRGSEAALHLAAVPLRRRTRSRSRAWHPDLQPQRARHFAHARWLGVPLLRSSDSRADGARRAALLPRPPIKAPVRHLVATLRVRRPRLRPPTRGFRRRRIRNDPAREPHLRDHRGRRRLPQRAGRDLSQLIQREGPAQAHARKPPHLHAAVQRAPTRLRECVAPASKCGKRPPRGPR